MRAETKPALAGWLLVAAVTSLPYVHAALLPPPGQSFVGALFYVDDFMQYGSFAEQAARGAFVFSNKFDVTPHAAVLVNVEWWLAGVLGAAVGDPLSGFQGLRVLGIVGLLTAAARLLARAGLAGASLRWALGIFALGGGFGWLRYAQGVALWSIPDLATDLYPAHLSIGSGHSLVGAALLLWTIESYLAARGGETGRSRWIVCAWLLGLSRPYDLAGLAPVIAGLGVVDARSVGLPAVVRRVVGDALWLAPIVAYYGAISLAHPSFAGWGNQVGDLTAPRVEYLFALAPPALLIAQGGRREGSGVLETVLAWWCLSLAALLFLWQSPMAKQCTTTLGAGLLLWAAVRMPARALPFATLGLLPSFLLVLWISFRTTGPPFASRDTFAAVDVLAQQCSPGDVAIAPTDMSLMIAAKTPCHVALGHRLLTPRFQEEVADGNRFYDSTSSQSWRRAYLERRAARFVALPAGAADWLNSDGEWNAVLIRPAFVLLRRADP